MDEAFRLLLSCSVSMAVVAALAAIVTPLLEKRYARRALYGLWIIVMLGFLIPVRIQGPAVVKIEIPAAQTAVLVPDEAQRPAAFAPTATMRRVQGAENGFLQIDPMEALAAVYFAVAAMILLRHVFCHLRFMRTVRRWQRPVRARNIRAVYAAAVGEMGVPRAPRLMICPAVQSPMLVGILKPRILLPERFDAGEALPMVLRHELAHHRQHDLIIRALGLLVGALHWLNPLAHLCIRMTENYCELACDERVMCGTNMQTRAAYGRVIVACLKRGRIAGSPLTTGFSLDKRMIKRRLLDMLETHGRRRGTWLLLLAAVLTLTVGAGIVIAEQSERMPLQSVQSSYASPVPLNTPTPMPMQAERNGYDTQGFQSIEYGITAVPMPTPMPRQEEYHEFATVVPQDMTQVVLQSIVETRGTYPTLVPMVSPMPYSEEVDETVVISYAETPLLERIFPGTGKTDRLNNGVAVHIAQASDAAQIGVNSMSWAPDAQINLSLSALRNVFIVTQGIWVNGYRLISTSQNDLENSWLHNPLRDGAGGREATICLPLEEWAFDTEDDDLQAELARIQNGGECEIVITLSLLQPKNGLQLVDTTELSGSEAWKRIDEAAAQGLTPIDSEPWAVLPSSAWMNDGATSMIGDEMHVAYPLGDKQVLIDHANMVEVDTITLRIEGI